jgi:WD40 repeat protein
MPNADVFISYAREDRSNADLIFKRLTDRGLTVWLDNELTAGKSYYEQIWRELETAKVVLVCWTPEAHASQWVRGEATEAMDRNTMLPILIKRTKLRPPFNQHALDFTDWHGEVSHGQWLRLIEQIEELIKRPIPSTVDFEFTPRVKRRIPPASPGERWKEIALFSAGSATHLWKKSESFLVALEWADSSRVIFTAGQVNGLRCWTEEGVEIEHMKARDINSFFSIGSANFHSVMHVATASDGPLCIWSEGWYEGTRYVLRCKHDFDDGYVSALSWRPITPYAPQKLLALSLSNRNREGAVCLWNVDTDSEQWSHPCSYALRLFWSPTGDYLAALDHKGTGFEIFRFNGERLSFQTSTMDEPDSGKARMGFAWHPSGQYFATGISDREVGLFEMESLQLVGRLPIDRSHWANGSPLRSVQWSGDGRFITASTALDTTVIFNVNQGVQVATLYATTIDFTEIAFSPDGQRLATLGKNAVRIWNPADGEEVAVITSSGPPVRQICWNAGSKRIALADQNGYVKIAELEF